MKKTGVLFFVALLVLGVRGYGYPGDYAVVSKSLDDDNFKHTVSGCNAAAVLNGDRCVHIGPRGPADARNQAAVFGKAVRSGQFSGFAISVVMSETVAKIARKIPPVPIISFDSPFYTEDDAISMAYVGTDNLAFGRDLARSAKKLHPGGGTLFLMGDLHDWNLARRIHGIRQELSGMDHYPSGRTLTGQGGWWEFPRSPWVSGDDIHRALAQVSLMLKSMKPDVFISVGHWPIIDPGAYRKAMAPFAEDLRSGRHRMIFGVGEITPGFQGLLDDGLVHGLVSIDFFEIGRQVYHILHRVSHDMPVAPRTFIPNIIRYAD